MPETTAKNPLRIVSSLIDRVLKQMQSANITLLVATLILWSAAGHAAGVERVSNSSPRLIVVIVVDQMRADYIERYAENWKGGIRRLLDEGAVFTQAEYQYFSAATCPGHATIATGLNPSEHGLIANAWYDRVNARKISCSIKSIRAPTLADALQKHGSRGNITLSLSQKKRVSGVMGGQNPSAEVSLRRSRWKVSSARNDGWKDQIHQALRDQPIEADRGSVWTPIAPTTTPPGDGKFYHPLSIAGESKKKFYGRWVRSPYSDASLNELAVAMLERSDLGQSDRTDYLAIGFSALDRVGHRFGPNSAEVRDVLLRLDNSLGNLFSVLDRKVGPDRYLVAFTADHGVAPTALEQSAMGIDAGRVSREEVIRVINTTLQKLYGPGNYVSKSIRSNVYLAPGVMKRLKSDSRVRLEVGSELTSLWGIAEVIWTDTLNKQKTQSMTPMQRRISREYVPDRSGDLLLVPKPYWTVGSTKNAADHTTGYEYDVKVPMILMGKGIAAGQYDEVVSPMDIAPTLAHITGISFVSAKGRVLINAISTRSK